jgi:6-pyruvoyl-tetrahydropterin synthase
MDLRSRIAEIIKQYDRTFMQENTPVMSTDVCVEKIIALIIQECKKALDEIADIKPIKECVCGTEMSGGSCPFGH